jgi:hypothetical protein
MQRNSGMRAFGLRLVVLLAFIALPQHVSGSSDADADNLGLDSNPIDDLDDDADLEEESIMEEYEISSPREVNDLWMKVIRETQKRGEKVSLTKDSTLHKEATEEAHAQLGIRPKRQKRAQANALLAGPTVRYLPPAADNGTANGPLTGGAQSESSTSNRHGAVTARGMPEAQALVMTEMYNKSLQLAENISKGVIAGLGALAYNETQASEDQKPDLSTMDVVWTLARKMKEGNESEQFRKRKVSGKAV